MTPEEQKAIRWHVRAGVVLEALDFGIHLPVSAMTFPFASVMTGDFPAAALKS